MRSLGVGVGREKRQGLTQACQRRLIPQRQVRLTRERWDSVSREAVCRGHGLHVWDELGA